MGEPARNSKFSNDGGCYNKVLGDKTKSVVVDDFYDVGPVGSRAIYIESVMQSHGDYSEGTFPLSPFGIPNLQFTGFILIDVKKKEILLNNGGTWSLCYDSPIGRNVLDMLYTHTGLDSDALLPQLGGRLSEPMDTLKPIIPQVKTYYGK